VSVAIFSQQTNLVYLVFPLLIWSALRFWQAGAAAGSVLLAIIAVAFTNHGHGPFAMEGPDERLLLAQSLVAVAGITAMVLAVVTSRQQRTERALREISGILQESLLPAKLPQVPKVELAAFFAPAGEGHRVGGDFYDVFNAGDGSWGLAVGDVCGKGPRAASLTALARYTLRAAALYERDPRRILGSLNDAVWQHFDASEFCTAVYARLELASARPKLTISSGGHPLPLVLRADGTVEQLGRPGTLLGADPAPQLVAESVELAPGESVLFYTDGLIDAYAPKRIVEIAELEAVLSSCAGRVPSEIVGEISRSLLRSADVEPRDDVAMVVLQAVGDRAAPRLGARARRTRSA
jgi:serine phosphatase RsbU (regulator of sigma subunit)